MMGRGGVSIYTSAMGKFILPIMLTSCYRLLLAASHVLFFIDLAKVKPDAGTEELIGYSGAASSLGSSAPHQQLWVLQLGRRGLPCIKNLFGGRTLY